MPLEEDAKRLLQDVSTGTGEYEGWLGVLEGGKATGPVTLLANKNLWGSDRLSEDNRFYTKIGGDSASDTTEASPWQLASPQKITFKKETA